jgi:hypothetical protein
MNELRTRRDTPTVERIVRPPMWSSRLFHKFRRIAFPAVFVCLCSCDTNFFGPDSREIAGGYRLKRVGNPRQFALITPHGSGGPIIDEIGWHEPLIVARGSGSEYWYVINTARAQRTSITDAQRKSDAAYQSIQIEPAEAAWNRLDRRKRRW